MTHDHQTLPNFAGAAGGRPAHYRSTQLRFSLPGCCWPHSHRFSRSTTKKDCCRGNDYVGNRGGKYPHRHCGKDFFMLCRSASDHINLHGTPNCNKVDEILGDPARNYGSAGHSAVITNTLSAYPNAGHSSSAGERRATCRGTKRWRLRVFPWRQRGPSIIAREGAAAIGEPILRRSQPP